MAVGGIEPRNIGPQPPKEESHDGPITALTKGIWLILKSVQRVFRIRSFQVILLVGIIETFHWVSPLLYFALHPVIMPQHCSRDFHTVLQASRCWRLRSVVCMQASGGYQVMWLQVYLPRQSVLCLFMQDKVKLNVTPGL